MRMKWSMKWTWSRLAIYLTTQASLHNKNWINYKLVMKCLKMDKMDLVVWPMATKALVMRLISSLHLTKRADSRRCRWFKQPRKSTQMLLWIKIKVRTYNLQARIRQIVMMINRGLKVHSILTSKSLNWWCRVSLTCRRILIFRWQLERNHRWFYGIRMRYQKRRCLTSRFSKLI